MVHSTTARRADRSEPAVMRFVDTYSAAPMRSKGGAPHLQGKENGGFGRMIALMRS